ncbi:HotDog domain-containing protein [Aspergillus egyptiacus]|nr:HotDog domain-containing protein [Aspergillus egyptiacus]
MPGVLSSTFIRTVPTTTRLHVSGPATKGLKFARFPHFPPSLHTARLYSTADAPSVKPRSLLRRFVGFASIAVFTFSAGYAFRTYRSAIGMMTLSIPTDEETLTAFTPSDEFTQQVEDHIQNHPLTVSLREDPAYTASRPHLKVPEKIRLRNLTAGTLSNPQGIVVPPLVFYNKETSTMVSLFYLGPSVSGHPGIVHGGLLATLLDEGMGRCAFQVLPNKVGVTANLNVDYRRPAMANKYFVMRGRVAKSEGRKAWIEAHIETLPEEGQEPEVLVEARSLFVEPKGAAAMGTFYKFSE